MVGVAGISQTWTPASFIESTVAEIRDRVDAHARAVGSDGKVICALSGGVDSAVAAALVHRAVGDRLTCIYVDHGLMRKRESELLRATFGQNLGMRLVMIDAEIIEFMRRGAAADADLDTAAAEMIQHADFFGEPQRMMRRQHIDQRAEPDAARALGDR